MKNDDLFLYVKGKIHYKENISKLKLNEFYGI